jgi:hypothetical protein
MNFLKTLLENKSLDPNEVMSKLKAAERGKPDESDTKGFALEDDNGNIVRVRVPRDQAEDFERALGNALDEKAEDDVEIAEVLYELKDRFDIVDVDWGEGTIPEDEETDNELEGKGDDEPVDADVEGPEGEMGGDEENPFETGDTGEEGGDEEGGDEDENPMAADDMDVEGASEGGSGDAFSALQSVIDMMKADAEARSKEADAEKAKASVEAGKVAAQAAAARTKSEEEILDMENFNKRSKEEKRQRDLQAKLIRYRHELENGDSQKSGDPSMAIGESMYPHASPEEEEVLDMEKWEEEEKERKNREKTHERLKAYRHAKKNGEVKSKPKHENEESSDPDLGAWLDSYDDRDYGSDDFDDVRGKDFDMTFKDFMSQQDNEQDDMMDDINLKHRAQY